MKTREYFVSYNFKSKTNIGWGSATLKITDKLTSSNLNEYREILRKQIEKDTDTEVDNVVFMFIKDVTNGF